LHNRSSLTAGGESPGANQYSEIDSNTSASKTVSCKKNAEIYFCHLNLSAQPDDKAFDNTKDK
jgi:hypothetical protein